MRVDGEKRELQVERWEFGALYLTYMIKELHRSICYGVDRGVIYCTT